MLSITLVNPNPGHLISLTTKDWLEPVQKTPIVSTKTSYSQQQFKPVSICKRTSKFTVVVDGGNVAFNCTQLSKPSVSESYVTTCVKELFKFESDNDILAVIGFELL